MKNRIITSIAAILALACVMPSGAEDIDLFMGPTDLSDKSAPNVLFIMDNTANWNTPFIAEKAALQSVFASIKSRIEAEGLAINIGLMMFSETGNPNNNVSGGYVRAAIRPMGDEAGGKKYTQLYSDLIGGLDKLKDKGNGGDAGLTMAEAYLYFSEGTPYAGKNKVKADYKLNTFNTGSCCGLSKPVWALPGNALASFSGTKYDMPAADGSCGKNYIIFISNGPAQDSTSGSRISEGLLTGVGGDITMIGLAPSGSATTTTDEWARFMKKVAPEAITTFTVDVLPGGSGQGPGWSRLLKSMADESGGVAYTVDNSGAVAEGLVGAINDALDRILAKNSVFASVALPAASNAQSTFLNQVFIGQFRPDPDALPRWPGNLKQYKLAKVGSDLKVVDADGDSIVDPGTGFIEKCTNSFWSTADTYWSGALALDLDDGEICKESSPDSSESNAPDGPIVEKGGQAQQLRAITPGERRVFTCSSTFGTCSTTSSLANFSTTNTGIPAVLSDPSINWARGMDIDDEDGDGTTDEMRASVHGDVIHSRPVAINYNTDASPKVVVFYSGNDGMLRAINGNRPDINNVNVGGVVPGAELWSFMPPEFYDYIDTLRTNSDTINFPSSSADAPTDGIAKPYGIDGPITAFRGDVPDLGVSGVDKKYLYAGMRRLGRALYAFDVTAITDSGSPAPAPTMLWKRGCSHLDPDDALNVCTTGWEDIGQTWSQPNVIYANGYVDGSGVKKPMLIMGGGYDDCEDFDNDSDKNHNCGGNPKGSQIFLLDAYTGNIIQTFDTDRGVVGAVTVVTYSDANRAAQYAYATDLGGNIYRISGGTEDAPAEIGSTAPASTGGWVMKKIASLGCEDPDGGCDANRKFLFGPDVVRNPTAPSQLTILVGSGDREKPLENYGAAESVDNYFFAVIDQPANTDWLNESTDTAIKGACDEYVICLDALTSVTTAGDVTVGSWGWRLPLATGEQVVTGAITVADTAYFSTHIPAKADEACAANLGTATAYSVDYRKAKGDDTNIIGGGLVPTPVAGMVILDGNTKGTPFCIGCGGEESAIGAKLVGSGITWTQPKSHVYWKIQQ